MVAAMKCSTRWSLALINRNLRSMPPQKAVAVMRLGGWDGVFDLAGYPIVTEAFAEDKALGHLFNAVFTQARDRARGWPTDPPKWDDPALDLVLVERSLQANVAKKDWIAVAALATLLWNHTPPADPKPAPAGKEGG